LQHEYIRKCRKIDEKCCAGGHYFEDAIKLFHSIPIVCGAVGEFNESTDAVLKRLAFLAASKKEGREMTPQNGDKVIFKIYNILITQSSMALGCTG